MDFLLRRNSIAVVLVLVALAIRAGIPTGYMPAMPGSGLLVELCPSALPASFAQVLRERRPVGHRHAHHGHEAYDAATESASHTKHESESCPLGHLLLSAVVVDTSSDAEPLPRAPEAAFVTVVVQTRATRKATSSRGPPV